MKRGAAARHSRFDERLLALRDAADLARGRLPVGVVAELEAVVAQAGERLGLGMDATVVALAGPTGAGKSSVFNGLAGADLSPAGHLRPTTSSTGAAVWGDVDEALLDWLGASRRHRRSGEPDGLVLLDLPDFDSIEHAHRVEAERVIAIADLTVWVVDPQKYADRVLHADYLQRLGAYQDAMVVVLNQADRLDAAARADCVRDIERLLTSDGLPGLPVLTSSATSEHGLDQLRAELTRRVAAREAALQRLDADVRRAAQLVAAACGPTAPGSIRASDRAALTAAAASAAGVPVIVGAVQRAHRRRGALRTGWPLVRWARRFRPDPLRRLRLADRTPAESIAPPDGAAAVASARSSMRPPTPAQSAQVTAAARALADNAAGDLPEPWPALTRRAALAREQELPHLLEAATTRADLRMSPPRWWRVIGALQVLLLAAAVVGALWLLALIGLDYLRLGDIVPTPEYGDLPLPTLLLAAGTVGGLALGMVAGAGVRVGSGRRARRAERALTREVAAATEACIVEPVQAELAAWRGLSEAAARATSPR